MGMLDIVSTTFLGNYLIAWHYAQSANSLGQNPCTVAAYLISTCYGGCEWSSFLSCAREPWRLISFAAYTIDALPNGTAYTTSQNNNLCVCNTVAYSLLSACDGCQGDVWVPYDNTSLSSFQILDLMYLTSAIRNILPTAQMLWLPGGEFPLAPEKSLRLML
jgi:hypothetical protein